MGLKGLADPRKQGDTRLICPGMRGTVLVSDIRAQSHHRTTLAERGVGGKWRTRLHPQDPSQQDQNLIYSLGVFLL